MLDQDKTDGWDEVIEEADELACVHKDPLGGPFLSPGTSKRSKTEKKPTFSLRGYKFAPLDMEAEILCIGGQEGTSRLPTTKASETMMAERLDYIEERTEDLQPEFAFATHKANTSVSKLLENLQGRSGSSVRIPASMHQHAPDTAIREQEVSSEVSPTKASQTETAKLLGDTKEDTEDLPSEFVRPTKKADISVAELLEDLQGRSGSSVRTSASLHQHAPYIAIGKLEVSSRVPPAKASRTLMAELLGSRKEDKDFPSESAHPTKKSNISVAELLEDLQSRSGSFVGVASSLHQHTRARDRKSKLSTYGKKTVPILGERSHDSEDPLEHVTDGTSSEEEEVIQDCRTLVNKDVKQQTMTDLFQEIYDPTNMEGAMLPVRSTGAGYCRRMQKIMQMEKDRNTEFLRQCKGEQGGSKGITVQIMSRSLEGKLAVCRCLFQETSNLTLTSNASTDQTMDENRTNRTIIFSPKICDVDLLVGNMIDIFPPWKEIRVQEEDVILCTYFSHHGPL